MMRKFRKSESGFTLIELLIVVALIGLLAAIAVPRLAGTRDRAIIADGNSALGIMNTALGMYNAEEGIYPDPSTAGELGTALNRYVNNLDQILSDWAVTGYTRAADGNSFTLTISHYISDTDTANTDCRLTYDSSTGKITGDMISKDTISGVISV